MWTTLTIINVLDMPNSPYFEPNLQVMAATAQNLKYSFSGHDSFQCRQLWLKKGYDYCKQGFDFNAEDAVAKLGVGKNMVTAIRYWLKAFGITLNDQVTEFGDMIFNDNDGLDPYLEDEGTLWLLHYQLVNLNIASTYNIVFTEFRMKKIEFNKEDFVKHVSLRFQNEGLSTPNAKTIGDDFDVMKKLYLSGEDDLINPEEGYAGVLAELQLLKSFGKGKNEFYCIENGERPNLPWQIVFYCILINKRFGNSININSLQYDLDAPGVVFSLSKVGLLDKIEEAAKKVKSLVFSDQAGIKEVQFKKSIDPFLLLKGYYEK